MGTTTINAPDWIIVRKLIIQRGDNLIIPSNLANSLNWSIPKTVEAIFDFVKHDNSYQPKAVIKCPDCGMFIVSSMISAMGGKISACQCGWVGKVKQSAWTLVFVKR